jgi:hypothetical protein
MFCISWLSLGHKKRVGQRLFRLGQFDYVINITINLSDGDSFLAIQILSQVSYQNNADSKT